MNVKGIFKSIVAGATIIGGAILGNEARKCFTKPVSSDADEFDDTELEELENLEAAEENSAEEEADDEEETPED